MRSIPWQSLRRSREHTATRDSPADGLCVDGRVVTVSQAVNQGPLVVRE